MSRNNQEEPGPPGSLGFERPTLNAEGRSVTLQHYEPLKREDNPYDPFLQGAEAGGDGESVDDGINMDVSSSPSDVDTTDNFLMSSMPATDITLMKFEEFLEVNSPMRDTEENSFRRMSVEEKWEHVQKQNPHAPTYEASYYIKELKNHGALSKRRKSWGRSSRDSRTSLSYILRKLKEDLHMAYPDFLHQFVSLNGVQALAGVLKEIQTDQQASGTGKKAKMELFKQFVQDEYDCLLCIKFTRKREESLVQLINMNKEFECVVQCIYSSNVKTRIVTLQIICMVCEVSGGFNQVVECLSNLQMKNREMVKFHTLVTMLNKRENIRFQVWCVRLFNCLWKCTLVANAKVYLQYELEQAGFDPDALDRYGLDRGPEFEELQKELDLWRKNNINVAGSRQELVELENRNTYLRQEIDRQNMRIKEVEEKLNHEKKSYTSMKDKCDQYRERAAELQDTVEKLTTIYKDKTGEDPDPSVKIDEVTRPLDIYGTLKSVKFKRSRSRVGSMQDNTIAGSIGTINFKPRPSLPLPPPPMNFKSQTVGRKFNRSSNTTLPLFHFATLHTITNSLFEDIDDEAKLREIDFTEFESKFKLNTPQEPSKKLDRLHRMMRKSAQKIAIIDTDRARNMIITMRRIGMTADKICLAINDCNVKAFPEEMAEQLLKYIPTKEEIKQLSEYENQYSSLGDAEQFMFKIQEGTPTYFQLMQVERLESKLAVIAFMEIFDELSGSVEPEIDMIYRNSQNILQCTKLKKVFEIILAFGNYMNSNRKGYVMGFKLESLKKLNEIKSTHDKNLTLLHYLEEFIGEKYPELHQFYEELDLEYEKGVSYQAIFSDVVGLRKGLDQIKFEMDRQHDNQVIADFFQRGSSMVTEIADSFHNMEKVYEKVCSTFGESHKTVETEDVFRPLMEFCADFQKAGRENYKKAHPELVFVSPVQTPRNTTPSALSPAHSITVHTNLPTYSNTGPQMSKSARSNSPITKFSFENIKLKHVEKENKPPNEPEEDYYDDTVVPVPIARTSSESSLLSRSMPSMSQASNQAVASMVQIPSEILQHRRNLSEASVSSHDTNSTGDILVTTSHSKMFPAVRKSSAARKEKKKPTAEVEKQEKKKESTENGEHKPVIKQPLHKALNDSKKANARKLPRVPIDTDSETYYNAYNKVGRKPSAKRTNILPDKPSVGKAKTSSSSFREPVGTSLYEDIPYDRQNGEHKVEESVPPVPIKTEDAYKSAGSVKRRAPKPPAPPAPPAPPSSITSNGSISPDGQLPSPNVDKQYRSQVSQVLNELNLVLDMNGPTSPLSPMEEDTHMK